MARRGRILLYGFSSLLLAACATDSSLQSAYPSPQQLSSHPGEASRGASLQWGGEIVAVENLQDRTLLEVLAYPLRSSGEPRTDREPLGRFLADNKGFLEPREYRPGRQLTVSGTLLGFRDGRIGDAFYRYPAWQVEMLTLWPEDTRTLQREPRVNLGIGVGSHGRSGVGIGIGF